jgi:hypothetical protein
MKKYALRHKPTKELLRLEIGYDGDHSLSHYKDDGEIFLLDDPMEAEFIRLHNKKVGYHSYGPYPDFSYEVDELEVVAVNIEVEVIHQPTLPTAREVLTARYGKEGTGEIKQLERMLKDNVQYSLHQLKDFLRDK